MSEVGGHACRFVGALFHSFCFSPPWEAPSWGRSVASQPRQPLIRLIKLNRQMGSRNTDERHDLLKRSATDMRLCAKPRGGLKLQARMPRALPLLQLGRLPLRTDRPAQTKRLAADVASGASGPGLMPARRRVPDQARTTPNTSLQYRLAVRAFLDACLRPDRHIAGRASCGLQDRCRGNHGRSSITQ